MRSVLILSYYFPPVGGAGAQRPAAFVRYLPRSGYQPIVVTGPGPAHSRWTPQDESLLAKLPDGTAGATSARSGPVRHGLRPRASGSISRASDGLGSVVDRRSDHVRRGSWKRDRPRVCLDVPVQLGGRGKPNRGKLRLPWIADLGDPWALDEMMVYPTRAHRRLAIRQMRDGLQSAAAIVMSTQEAVFRVREAFPEFDDKHDRRDSEWVRLGRFRRRRAGPVTQTSSGIVHTRVFPYGAWGCASEMLRPCGGSSVETVPGVDFLTRSHYFLLEAVDRLPAGGSLAGAAPRDPSRRCAFGGRPRAGCGVTRHAVARIRLATRRHWSCSAQPISSSLPMQDLRAGVRATIVPGKTYEYLATGRPILAAVPDGDARDTTR